MLEIYFFIPRDYKSGCFFVSALEILPFLDLNFATKWEQMKFVMHREGKFVLFLKSSRAEIAQEDFCEPAMLPFPKNPLVIKHNGCAGS